MVATAGGINTLACASISVTAELNAALVIDALADHTDP
jgi:hypothetical protein